MKNCIHWWPGRSSLMLRDTHEHTPTHVSTRTGREYLRFNQCGGTRPGLRRRLGGRGASLPSVTLLDKYIACLRVQSNESGVWKKRAGTCDCLYVLSDGGVTLHPFVQRFNVPFDICRRPGCRNSMSKKAKIAPDGAVQSDDASTCVLRRVYVLAFLSYLPF